MLFSSSIFLFNFLPITLFIYYVFLRNTKQLKNYFLLIMSLIFYAWGEPKFVIMLIFSIIINWFCGLLIDKKRNNKKICKLLIVLTLMSNLSVLLVFKYLGFLVTNLNSIFSFNLTVPQIALPIGISFFTFQAISYVIDVYRGNGKVQKNILNVGLYLAFFPQLIAGPIVRYETIAEQINNRKENFEDFSKGTYRFLIGLFKKVLISNQMALVANIAFDGNPTSVLLAWLCAIAYALQIYFDFSGYSDMAIGLGSMFGFKFEENFDYPYTSKSITEFWRRWHMSLTSWFRDYLYIPLGGNRKGKIRKHMNTMIVFLVSGLWHGAGWNFIIWGGLNGFYIVCQDLTKNFRKQIYERLHINTNGFIFKWIARIAVFLMIDFSWLFFRVESLGTAMEMLSIMIKDFQISRLLDYQFWGNFITAESLVLLVLLILIAAFADYLKYKNINMVQKVLEQPWIVRWIIYYVLLAAILFLGAYGEGYEQTQFIYFQF